MGRGWGLVLALGLAACADAPQGRALGLLKFHQAGLDSVALNEDLLFYFDADLDRASVSTDSFRILDEQDLEVAGERTVRGNALTFRPALPCRADLSDGGLRPGELYRVVLGGFPRPDGIRSESGALLSATLLFSFKTAAFGGRSPVFLAPVSASFPLVPRAKRIQDHFELDENWILLECPQALEPSSVPNARFELSYFPAKAKELERIPLDVRLVVNRREHAELLLEPAGTPGLGGARLAPGDYYLQMVAPELRDLGGRSVELGRQLIGFSAREPRFELDFTSARERAGEAPPSCTGTASWEAGAGVRVRYPAAAGRGDAGDLELSGPLSEPDLHATRLTVPARTELDASPFRGLVVLRSQTSLEIRGQLTRHGRTVGPQDPLTQALVAASDEPHERQPTLSAWLAGFLDPARAGEPWTVLVAGGDILVPRGGSIEVDGPLVLVAGGSIRVEGRVFTHSYLWKTPEGGGGSAGARLIPLPLVLDPPAVNPLRTPLVVGALTRAFPWTPRAGRWRSTLVGHAGAGRLSVHYLQAPPDRELERWVNDPGELVAGPARALVRLEIGPGHGEAWDPPRLERLELQPGQVLSTEEVREPGEAEADAPR